MKTTDSLLMLKGQILYQYMRTRKRKEIIGLVIAGINMLCKHMQDIQGVNSTDVNIQDQMSAPINPRQKSYWFSCCLICATI